MRIAIVTRGDLYPTRHGAAVKIVRTAEYLSLQGAEVFVVTDNREHYLAYTNGRVREVPYGSRFRASQEWPGFAGAGRWAEKICNWVGYPQDEHFLYSAQFDPAWWSRVLYVGRTEKIAVFQAEFPGYGVACWLAAKLLGGKSAIVQHNVEWDRLQDILGFSDQEIARIRACERFALQRVDEIIAVSSDDKDRMLQAGLDPQRITVIPHGVDLCRYEKPRGQAVRFSYGVDEKAPLLFFHGTLHYWPNTEAVRFIAEELLPRLLPAHPDLRILIAGMNPPAYYRHPAIVYPGAVQDLAGHIAAADLTVCPVFSGGGTRLKLLEYFAAGKACVSTAKGAEGICYSDGQNIVIADDAAPMAEAVLELLAKPRKRARIGKAAKAFAAHYDWTPITRCYLDLYEGIDRAGDYNQVVAKRREQGEAALPALQLPPSERPAIEAHLPERDPSKDRTLLLLINRGCNLRCSFCDLWDNPEEMPFDKALGLLDEAVKIGTKTLVITGGEPFLYKPLFDLVNAAKARGMGVNITTNGTLIEKRWEELIASGVDSLSISIDGLPETHDRIRGQKGGHKRTLKGLQKVRAEGRIGISVYFVVTNQNVKELTQVYDQAMEWGLGFDFWPVNDAEDLYLRTQAEKSAYTKAVNHIAARSPDVAARKHFYAVGLDYHKAGLKAVRCLGLIDQYGVTYKGDLLPCCVWGADGLKAGNVFETPLSELWVSQKVQDQREGLYSKGCTEGCFNHSLYEFTKSTGESFRVG
jgi:MoaA/NifB/PqqE/SkfB family radical SAM enzyme/glycosyltransferase involved in cell wall biosynthesis